MMGDTHSGSHLNLLYQCIRTMQLLHLIQSARLKVHLHKLFVDMTTAACYLYIGI